MPKFLVGGEQFDLIDEEDLLFAEARAMQKHTGKNLGVLVQGIEEGDMDALQAFMWVSMKRVKPELKFTDLDDLPLAEFDVVDDELAEPAEQPEDVAPDPTPEPEPSDVSEPSPVLV